MNRELMMAVLAMDAYNRGYDAGTVVSGTSSGIGTAEYLTQSDVATGSPGRDESFYAVAYRWNGETIVSFRGTDDTSIDLSPSDIDD
ncbi:MAG: hypothetical protein ACKVP5_18980 [Aestuariivirga sp.]